MKISIAMTTFNGEKYIEQQLNSILSQICIDDEIIISDDGSTDKTVEIILEYKKNHPQIILIEGEHNGIIKNFENALKHCKNDYIFLCDQDDIWHKNKVATVLEKFKESDADVILHNANILWSDACTHGDFFEWRGVKKGVAKNILKNSYIGCCMALNKRFLQNVLPLPQKIPMHDQWIGILGEKLGKVEFVGEQLIYYRRHNSNASSNSHAGFLQMIIWRVTLIFAFLKRIRKIKRVQNGK